MSVRVFLTGGGGFVGRRLIHALGNAGSAVVALDRSGAIGRASTPGVTVIAGDLLAPASYREALRSCDVVVHLAAATGRASAADHMRVNAQGTDVLIAECRQAGVSKFLFVSSIATTFADKTGYHYALAKTLAEKAVAGSGLRFAILRPTIILGHGAPLLGSLEKLALLPLIVMPGNGRTRVQPIHVDDVVKSIVAVVQDDMFGDQTFEIGGPGVLTMEELLQHLRRARTGRGGGVLHIPLPLLAMPLRLAETVGLGALLPLSAGQLSSFRCDGVAAVNPLQQKIQPSLVDLSRMFASATAAVATAPVVEAADSLERECRIFTRHLLGREPDDYVITRYQNAHSALPALAVAGRFDALLLAAARTGSLATKIADSYAAVFARDAALRKRMVLLLAILETRPPFHIAIDQAVGGPMVWLFMKLAATAVAAGLSLIVGTLIFLPARVALAVTGKGAR